MSSVIVRKNLNWAAGCIQADPHIFRRRSENLNPKLLWIGCSDNALPSLETAAFEDEGCIVHRNIGNQVSVHDPNFLATLAYALQTARVERIVVCGHYGCDCLRAVLREQAQGMGEVWAGPIRTLHRQNRRQIDGIISEEAQIQTLCEMNVRLQVRNLADHPLIEPRLAVGNLKIEGVIWSARDGLLRDPGIVVARMAKTARSERPARREARAARPPGPEPAKGVNSSA